MDPLNPYAAPKSDGTDSAAAPRLASRRWAIRLGVAWTAVFLLNLPIPLLFAWDIGVLHGAVGMAAALIVAGLCGGWVCVLKPKFGFPLVVGGAVVALSQFFPALQLIAGAIAIAIGEMLGQVKPGRGDAVGQIASEAGGFLVTMITGLLLLTAAFAVGWPVQFLLPARWRRGPTVRPFNKTVLRPDLTNLSALMGPERHGEP
jgi:hypothetical protein